MPNDYSLVRDKRKEPENKSRIVIEGIDEPKKPEGEYSDKIKIDPFTPRNIDKALGRIPQVQKT